MNNEIKQRIQQIKNGQVPKGYKKTKLGIIPEEWDAFKAKEIFKNISDKNHNGDLEVLSATQDKGVVPRSTLDINIKYDKSSLSNYKKVKNGNFVISLRSFQGGIEYSEYNGIVSPAYTVLDEKQPICKYFYKTYLKTDNYIKRLSVATYGIRDGKQIGYEDFGTITIPYPPLFEQEKIAKILETQDKIIELYQRKIEELQKLKKAYLSKMFPKHGSNVPEIRFPGFTEDWEQRKLSELGEITTGNTPSTAISDYYCDDGLMWVTPTDISGNIIYDTPKKLSKSGQQVARVVPKNTLLITCIASIGKNTMLGNMGSFNQQINGLTPNEKIYEPYFLLSESTLWSAQMKRSAAEGTMKIVNRTEFTELKTWVPKYEEQKRIGTYFRNLDNLITLHQRKLEEMKKYKKALMQLLLSGIVRV